MQSEFKHVPLDRIRYSLVWEDSQTLYDGLDINAKDHVLIITSAGCNVLNALLKNPTAITAVDLNPIQNKLLLLKKHIILNHDYETYQSLLGFAGVEAVSHAKEVLFKSLPTTDKSFWSPFFESHPDGLLTSGKLESYITGFYESLPRNEQEKLLELTMFENVNEQSDFFMKELDTRSFKESFINYFDDENLSKGRDPRLLKYATETGGEAFYNRLLQQLRSNLVSSNFYFRFFFFGPLDLPGHILPPCYRKENYDSLKHQLHKLQVITGEAINFLFSEPGSTINKASLSNIFEYTSRQEFEHVCHDLSKDRHRHLRLVFWNLLNSQGEHLTHHDGRLKIQRLNASPQSCFYFKNVLRMDTCPEPSQPTC